MGRIGGLAFRSRCKGGMVMRIKFATKRDINGNRRYLAIDTEGKSFAVESPTWYCREDIIEITKKDIRALLAQCIDNGYQQVDFL